MIALAIIAGLGGWLRLARLDEWAFSPDELIHLLIVKDKPLSAAWTSGLSEAPHPPLFAMLLHPLVALTHDRVALRAVSWLPGLALIPLMYALGRRVEGRAAGLTMAWIAAFGLGPLLMTQVVRPYALSLFCLTAAFIALAAHLQRGRAAALLAWAAGGLLAQMFCYAAVLPVAATGLVLAARAAWRREGPRRVAFIVACHAPHAAVLAAFFLWHRPELGWPHRLGEDAWLAGFFPSTPAQGWALLRGWFDYVFYPVPARPALVAAALGLVLMWRRGARALAAVALVTLALALILAAARMMPFGGLRHAFHLLPPLALATGACVQRAVNGAASLARRGPAAGSRGWRAAAWLALPLTLAPAAFALSEHGACALGRRSGAQGRIEFPCREEALGVVTARLARAVAPGDAVLAGIQTSKYFLFAGPSNRARYLSDRLFRVEGPAGPVHVVWSWALDDPAQVRAGLAVVLDGMDASPDRIWIVNIGWRSLAGAFDRDPGLQEQRLEWLDIDGAQLACVRAAPFAHPEGAP